MTEITNVSDDDLSRIVWTFWVELHCTREIRIHLDVMLEQSRPSKRHRVWTTNRAYHRLGHDRTHVSFREEPVVPPEVIDAAIAHVRARVVFVTNARRQTARRGA